MDRCRSRNEIQSVHPIEHALASSMCSCPYTGSSCWVVHCQKDDLSQSCSLFILTQAFSATESQSSLLPFQYLKVQFWRQHIAEDLCFFLVPKKKQLVTALVNTLNHCGYQLKSGLETWALQAPRKKHLCVFLFTGEWNITALFNVARLWDSWVAFAFPAFLKLLSHVHLQQRWLKQIQVENVGQRHDKDSIRWTTDEEKCIWSSTAFKEQMQNLYKSI